MAQKYIATLALLKAKFLVMLMISSLAYGQNSTDPTDSVSARYQHDCSRTALNILLTNDDGFDKPGIRALHRVFKHAGHRVILVAPTKNASGSSASLTLASVEVDQQDEDVYAINASPATAVLLGAGAFFGNSPPNLVISGINRGANLGPATPVSGTVGATIAAILILQPAIPAIAVSTNPLYNSQLSAEKNIYNDLKHLDRVAQFLVELVARLQNQHCNGSPLLPPGVALNVNYPPLPQNQIKGVKLISQGKAPLFSLHYARSEKDLNVYLPKFTALPANLDYRDGDTGAFNEGYITIVPIDGDYSANQSIVNRLAPGLQNLSP